MFENRHGGSAAWHGKSSQLHGKVARLQGKSAQLHGKVLGGAAKALRFFNEAWASLAQAFPRLQMRSSPHKVRPSLLL